MRHVPQIRVFLASPGDVNEERAIALEVLDMLEYDPLFNRDGSGGVSIHAIAWDKPGGGTPMRASMTPQTAIKQGIPQPSQCDIVLVIFWSRMGTPLPYPEYQKDDGSPYLSGTEWEFWNAITAERGAGKPITLIFRRTEDPIINIKDHSQLEQYRAVLNFFERFRDSTTGALLAGVNEYSTPEDFKYRLERYLRVIINDILTANETSFKSSRSTGVSSLPQVEAPPLWIGSPFPGLRSFDESDAPIFFGRSQETSELVKRVEVSRFVAVVAASGSGKSSLVAAGLIPRLKSNVIADDKTGSKDWRYVRFTPGQGKNPFETMFTAMCNTFPEHVISPFKIEEEKASFIDSIKRNPEALVNICQALLKEAKAPVWSELLFFVDQFEELFTLVADSDRTIFVSLLEVINKSQISRCIVTMRSDFTAQAIDMPVLATLLNKGNYMLAAPTAGALVEMIKRPAERAGLAWDDGLPEQIQAETGNDAGALALMAYALDELYHSTQADKRLTFDAYQSIGGVEGAIGKRAERSFEQLDLSDKNQLLMQVFRQLVTVDERGTATRQRAVLGQFSIDEKTLITAFINARLLVAQDNTVEVAHEAVFRSWGRLREWISGAQEDLILLRQVRNAAQDWDKNGRDKTYLWVHERLQQVESMIQRLRPELSPLIIDFIRPEATRLIDEIHHETITHVRRAIIGDRLAEISDPRKGVGLLSNGLPDIEWCFVPGGTVTLIGKQHPYIAPAYYIAKYPITEGQYKVFIDAEDGFHAIMNSDPSSKLYKFKEFFEKDDKKGKQSLIATPKNCPAINITWREAVIFCNWLTNHLKQLELPQHPILGNWEIRLPTEQEWIIAANGGDGGTEHPWGNEWISRFANTHESRLGRTTAVGMYPQGASWVGTMDMCGNIWEWVINQYYWLNKQMFYAGAFKSIKGAANSPTFDGFDLSFMGFRVVLASPIA